MAASPVRVDRVPERHPRALGHLVDRGARADLVEAGPDRLGRIEGANPRRLLETGQRRLALVLDGQVLPTHEHMFARGRTPTRRGATTRVESGHGPSHSISWAPTCSRSAAVLAQLGGHQLQAQLVAGAPDPGRGPGARSAPRSSSAGGPRRWRPPGRRAPGSGRRPGGRRDRRGCPARPRPPRRRCGRPSVPSAGRKRARAAGDAEEAAANPALGHQGADDLAGRRVDRHGQAEPDAGDRRVDAHHLTASVGERASRATGVEGGVGLDHVLDDSRRATARGSRQGTPERRHDAGRDRALEAVRVADRHHELADPQPVRVAERRRARARRPRPARSPGRRAGRGRGPRS